MTGQLICSLIQRRVSQSLRAKHCRYLIGRLRNLFFKQPMERRVSRIIRVGCVWVLIIDLVSEQRLNFFV